MHRALGISVSRCFGSVRNSAPRALHSAYTGSKGIRFEINLKAVLSHNQHDCAGQTEQVICVPPPLASVSKHGVNIKR